MVTRGVTMELWLRNTAVSTLAVMVTLTFLCDLAQGNPHRHRHGRHRHRTGDLDPVTRLLALRAQQPAYFSHKVTFALEKPRMSPTELLNHELDHHGDGEALQRALRVADRAAVRRRRRSATSEPRASQKQSVCDSVSEWTEIHEAEDMFGNTVQVVQEIDIGSGARVNQYFFETYCRGAQDTACRGIDDKTFYSVCENKYLWAYAKVRNAQGEEGWHLIKIRGSCNCALFKRRHKQLTLFDILGK